MTLADFTAYSSIQSEIEALYRDPSSGTARPSSTSRTRATSAPTGRSRIISTTSGTPPRWPDYGASSSLLLSRGTFVPFPSVRLEDAHVISPTGCARLPTDGV